MNQSDYKKFIDEITSGSIEQAKGVSLNPDDGSYVLKKSKTLRELMRLFQQWWNLVDMLKKTTDNADEGTRIVQTPNGIEADLVVKSAFDRYGRAIKEGLKCPVCGNRVKSLRTGGYCSTKCAMNNIKDKSLSFLLKPNDKYKHFQETLDRLIAILDQTSLILNALAGLPGILQELAQLPQEYKNYVYIKINEGFCYLEECMQKLIIKKNDLIKKLLRAIKDGWIAKPFMYVFTSIAAIQKALDAAQAVFDAAYTALIKLLSTLKVSGICIPAEGFAWTATPRSFMSPKPYTSPDAGKIFVNLPGGLGLQTIFATKPGLPSGLENINGKSIDAMIQKLFPPLTPLDFYLEPALFDVRYLFSDQSDLVVQIKQQLEDFLTFGFDYLPKFENLLPVKKFKNWMGTGKNMVLPNIAYVWFILALLDGWAPHSSAMVGSLINPVL